MLDNTILQDTGFPEVHLQENGSREVQPELDLLERDLRKGGLNTEAGVTYV
ncbi:hypothetical protein ACFSKO_12100 [Kiloniella antarctica]|uniref:Uncharacterized protein n=1 Tax=Kiloniella antarctica TaxID=1550907 RepID=A0ABW5BN77_9PROT